jgi:hypothetical protein
MAVSVPNWAMDANRGKDRVVGIRERKAISPVTDEVAAWCRNFGTTKL